MEQAVGRDKDRAKAGLGEGQMVRALKATVPTGAFTLNREGTRRGTGL